MGAHRRLLAAARHVAGPATIATEESSGEARATQEAVPDDEPSWTIFQGPDGVSGRLADNADNLAFTFGLTEPPPAAAPPRKKTPKQQAAVALKRAWQKDRKRRLKKGLNPPSPPCSPVDSPPSEPTLAKRMPEIRVMPSLDAALGR